MIKLSTGVLLVAALLLQCPAYGQSIQQSAAQTLSASMSSASMNKASFEAMSGSRLDRPQEIAVESPMQRGFSAAGFASALIEVLASQNAVMLEVMPSSSMDAYLRPPQKTSNNSGLFRQAKSLYDNATTIQSEQAEIAFDPLKMRCALRIKLNRLLSN